MRTIPVDAERVRFISTAKVLAVIAWVVLSDGTRKPDPNGRQEVDEATGMPLWRVEVIAPADADDDRDRTEVVEVTISSKDQPDPGQFGDVLVFDGLTMSPGYLNKRTNQVTAPRWAATGIRRQHGAGHKPQQQAA